jgi:hypothetical protein
LSINNSAVVSGNQDRSYGFSVRCIQAQGVTVFSDTISLEGEEEGEEEKIF